jgi:hypothetical protein
VCKWKSKLIPSEKKPAGHHLAPGGCVSPAPSIWEIIGKVSRDAYFL